MEVVDLTEHLPISPQHLKQIQEATNKDPTLQTLKHHILSDWTSDKAQVPLEVRPYVKHHNDLSIQEKKVAAEYHHSNTTEERNDPKGV